MSKAIQYLKYFSYIGFSISLVLLGSVLYFLNKLPDDSSLQSYKPNVMTRIHASNGDLVKEFSREYRIFVPSNHIPNNIKIAFISAEDKNFYKHFGVDILGITRAFSKNLLNIFSNKRPEGASTITQQVAKNFLLSDELSFPRKIQEALLAIKIERTLSKDRILELYLNQIYLGSGTYGIAAASNRYFNKSLSELNILIAFLAALPKAPSRYNPNKNYKLALERRNWVLDRMFANQYIDKFQLNSYKKIPIKTFLNKTRVFANDYYLEEIRKDIISIFGEDYLYNGGLSVRTSLNTSTQLLADEALKNGLLDYDKRHGYRGPIANDESVNWHTKYIEEKKPYNFIIAKVINFDDENDTVLIEVLAGKEKVKGILKNYKWARKSLSKGYVGPEINKASDIFEFSRN